MIYFKNKSNHLLSENHSYLHSSAARLKSKYICLGIKKIRLLLITQLQVSSIKLLKISNKISVRIYISY